MDITTMRSNRSTTTIKRSTACAAAIATVLVGFSLLGRATAPQVPANTWAPTSDMSVARAGASAVLLYDGRMLITGGKTDGGVSASAERFSPTSGAFLSTPSMATARANHTSTLLDDGRVLVAGGVGADGQALSAAEIYDPGTNSWMAAAPMYRARAGHTATTLFDGQVLFIGGASDASELASAELYDPAANTMTPIGASLAAARQRHHALLLPHNNAVLIVGGTANGQAVATAELYKSWSGDGGTFEAAGAPTEPRAWATGGALSFPAGMTIRTGPNDGLVLLAGGSPLADASSPRATAELYGFATVRTDKADYTPGQTVSITGSGWVPGETVTLTLAEVPFHDVHPLAPVTADASGNIVSTEFVPDPDDVGTRFYLTASGRQSQAQTSFTDALSITSASLNGSTKVTVAGGATINAAALVNIGDTVTWSGTGWSISQTPP